MRYAVAKIGALLLGLAGIALSSVALLMPIGFSGIDPAVMSEAGRGTEQFNQAGDVWMEAGKPGTAAIFDMAGARLRMNADELPLLPVRASGNDPLLHFWGGADPFLEQVFVRYQPRSDLANPPVAPLFIPRAAREELVAFLSHSRNPAVRAVMSNRDVGFSGRFMPVGTSAGQPLEATICLAALLLQGNHVSQELSADIRRRAEAATADDRLDPAEGIFLDMLSLGSRLQWQALADFLPLLPDRQALRRAAHLSRVLEDDWPVFVAAGLWTREASELSRYLVENGRNGLADLKQAILLGKGAVHLLIDRQEVVQSATWRGFLPEAPVLFADMQAHAPVQASVIKLSALFLGLGLVFLALNLLSRIGPARETIPVPASLTLLHSLLVATAFGIAFLFLTEPLAAREGESPEFQISLPVSAALTDFQSPIDKGLRLNMDQITILALAIFFVLQLILYLICCIKIMEIRRQPIANNMKLKLLENEDHLFDAGLYFGLAGTVGALIFLALGIVGPSLMAAYASTLFGIVFVAFFKIVHLRPYRRRLIIESQASA